MLTEKESQQTDTISIFRVIGMLTGIRLREGLAMEYALSLVMESQPQINLMGIHSDQITKDQVLMVAQGVSEAGEHRWRNLNPSYVDRITPILEKRGKTKKRIFSS